MPFAYAHYTLCQHLNFEFFISGIARPGHHLSGNNLSHLANRTYKLVEMVQIVSLNEQLQTSKNLIQATNLHLECKIVIISR